MRIADFPMIDEVQTAYESCRRSGLTRLDATQELIRVYRSEIATEDDGLLFWVGLADGQYRCKEITAEVAEKAMQALRKIADGAFEDSVSEEDIQCRILHYSQAPMPERPVRKRNLFRCDWKLGDTFAYSPVGDDCSEMWELGLGKSCFLLRLIDTMEFGDGRLLPVVTVSRWDGEELPENLEQFQTAQLLMVNQGGRCGSSRLGFEHRVLFVIKNKQSLDSLKLRYVGNFQEVSLPDEDIVFTNPGYLTMLLPERMNENCCRFWKNHLYCETIKRDRK